MLVPMHMGDMDGKNNCDRYNICGRQTFLADDYMKADLRPIPEACYSVDGILIRVACCVVACYCREVCCRQEADVVKAAGYLKVAC